VYNFQKLKCETTSLQIGVLPRKAIRYSVNYLSRDKCTGAEESKRSHISEYNDKVFY
jgi:hypothetical protein